MTQTDPISYGVSDSLRYPLSRFRSWTLSLAHNAWVPLMLGLILFVSRKLEFSSQGRGDYVMHVAMIAGINIILALSLQLINGISGQFSLGHAGFMAIGAYLAGYGTFTFAPRGYDPDVDYPDPVLMFANPGAVLLFFVAMAIITAIAAAAIGLLFTCVKHSRKAHPVLPILFTLALLAWVVIDANASVRAADIPRLCIWSRSAVLLLRLYNGIIASGAPAALWFTDHLFQSWRKPACLLIAIIGGGCAAGIAGLLVGLPTLRLRGDYLAIATLGFAEIIRNAIVTIPALGAATGLSVNVYWTKPSPADHINEAFYISTWIFGTAAITFLIISRLVYSAKGKAIQTVRDDEIAAAAIGIDPTKHRVIAFVTGAFFAGVAGALYVHMDGYLNTNSFSFLRSIEIVVMVTLGGLGSLWGAMVAAIALTAIPILLDNADRFLPAALAHQAHWMADNRLVLYALLLIVIMIVRAKWSKRRKSTRGAI